MATGGRGIEGLGYDLDDQVLFRLFRVSNLVVNRSSRFIAEGGLTIQQWSVVATLAREPAGMSVNQLSDFLLVSRQNLTDVLTRLERRGLTRREVDPDDRRLRRIVLTEEGRAVMPGVVTQIARFYEGALEGFSQDDQRTFVQLLDRLKDNLARS